MFENPKEVKPVDSCVHQLIAITPIFTSVDANLSLEFSSTCLELSKALMEFDMKVSYTSSKKWNRLCLIESFNHSRYQKVALNGQSSKMQYINTSASQR